MAKKLFEKGNTAAKKRGPNKITRSVREGFLNTFITLQEDPKTDLLAFAKKYPRDFYHLSSKLIPTEIQANVKSNIKVIHGMVVT